MKNICLSGISIIAIKALVLLFFSAKINTDDDDFQFFFDQFVFRRLLQVRDGRVTQMPPKENLWRLLKRDFLQAGCPSGRPTNSVKALKGIKH